MSGVPIDQAELELLVELASGFKTFEQVKADAVRFGLPTLIHSNPSRGITARLKELTGISKESLTFFPIRCKLEAATNGSTMPHPFVLPSTIVEKCLEKDEYFFQIHRSPIADDVEASKLINSPEYLSHELVQECLPRGETVIPMSLYSDGLRSQRNLSLVCQFPGITFVVSEI